MLTELRIENFAIIDKLELSFTGGFTAFTGETGAGKSIIIDAVETLLGGRADSTMVRSGADRAYVEGTFRIPEKGPVKENLMRALEREELLDSSETVTLAREIRLNGRNVARVNGRSVSTVLLSEVGQYLVDVHGQSEHLSLLRVREHLGLLDSFAGNEEQLEAYQTTYRKLQAVRKEIAEIRQAEKDAARRADLLQYQINEIAASMLKPGEEEEFKEERNRLANAEGLAGLVQESLQLLDEGDLEAPSITDMFGQLSHALSQIARLDPSQAELDEQAQEIAETLSELSLSLHTYQENIEFNPKRLDQVEERLALIHNLTRKYGGSIEAVLEFAEEAQKELDSITHASERLEELAVEEEELIQTLARQGAELSKTRRASAQVLCKAVEAELADLHMTGAVFDVRFEQKPDPQGVPLEDGSRVAFSSHGLEQVEFMVAPNPGEGLKPLVKIASGGETSRLMLALKNVLASADQIPTLIFDEIDQGIGGRVGGIVGKKLWNLGRKHQVLCITHLPQLAAYGEQHFRIQKQVDKGRTHTIATPIEGDERLLELALMLGEVSAGTKQSASELLAMAKTATE